MKAYLAKIEVTLFAESEEQAYAEAERIAFREDGGTLISVEEVQLPDDEERNDINPDSVQEV